ncbi:hypothetical protein BCEP27_90130 [Burkholderia cepacia]
MRFVLHDGPIAIAERPVPPFGRVIREAGAGQRVDQDLAVVLGRAADERVVRVARAGGFLVGGVHDAAHVELDAFGRDQRQVDGGARRMGGDFRRCDVMAGQGDQGVFVRQRIQRPAQVREMLGEVLALQGQRAVAFLDVQAQAGGQRVRGGDQPFRHAATHFQEMRAPALDIASVEIDGDAVMEGSEIDEPFVRLLQGNGSDNGVGERYHDSGRRDAITVAGHEPMSGEAAAGVLVRRIANMPASRGRCAAARPAGASARLCSSHRHWIPDQRGNSHPSFSTGSAG